MPEVVTVDPTPEVAETTDTPTPSVSFSDRVAQRAESVRFVRLLLSLLAIPFYLLGLLVGVLILAVRWCYAAVAVGLSDVAARGDTDAR